MRKLLLATTALVGVAFIGTAQAAETPVSVTVGGYVDFRAALFHDSDSNGTANAAKTGSDFETVYQIDIAAKGKASNGVEYGAKVGLWNGKNDIYDNDNSVKEHDANVWLSGNWGKAIFGDAHSASVDMFVGAPTVGQGQIDGNFTDFVSSNFFVLTPAYVNDDENGTKVTYYTPKVGNANHKVQLGVSFEPNYGEQGSTTSITKSNQGAYKNVTGAAAKYDGKLGAVAVAASTTMNVGSANSAYTVSSTPVDLRDFTTVGGGVQLTYAGVTVGGSYTDAGHMGMKKEDAAKQQDAWTFGAKYGFNKVEVAASILQGRGYNNAVGATQTGYVRNLQEAAVGATYTWFPGLTTAADLVFFQQKMDDDYSTADATNDKTSGHVFLVSQKLAF